MIVRRTNIVIRPNAARVLFRPFNQIDEARVVRIFARVMSLRDDEVTQLLEHVMHEFRGRHHRLQQFFLLRFEQMRRFMVTDPPLAEERRMLIGSYFTQEYSVESAALFNPSMVWHPDQSWARRRALAASCSACGRPGKGTSRRSLSAPA